MENAGYLLGAFGVLWLFTFGLVFRLILRQGQLKREINMLKEAQKEKK